MRLGVHVRGEAPDDERAADALRAVERQRQAGAEAGRERALTIASGPSDTGTRLVVTDDLGLRCEHARVPDLVGRVPTSRITRDRVVAFVTKGAAGGVLPEDGEGSTLLLQVHEHQPIVRDEPAQLRGTGLEEATWVELAPVGTPVTSS